MGYPCVSMGAGSTLTPKRRIERERGERKGGMLTKLCPVGYPIRWERDGGKREDKNSDQSRPLDKAQCVYRRALKSAAFSASTWLNIVPESLRSLR